MMMPRLNALLETDTASRWRIISISAVAVAAFGWLITGLTHKPVTVVQPAACIFGAVVFSAQVIIYCFGAQAETVGRAVVGGVTTKLTRRLAFAAASASVLLLLDIMSSPLLEGAMIDRKLRRLTQRVPLSENAIDQVTDVIKEADRAKVKIPDRTKETIKSALKVTTESDPALFDKVVGAEAALASYSTANATKQLQSILLQGRAPKAEATGKVWWFQPLATNRGPDNYQTTDPSHQPDVARMQLLADPQPPASDYGPGFLIVQGLTAALDGFDLKRIIFKNMKLTYHGGALVMEQVYFLECQFDVEPGPKAGRLLAAILLSGGGPINFSAP